MTKNRRNLRILASIIAAGCVWASGMGNVWAADTADHGNSYEAMVVLTANTKETGTGLGITLYRGDKESGNHLSNAGGVQYMSDADAKKILGDLWNDSYVYTKVESSATADFIKNLNTTIVRDVKAMVENGQNVYISGDGTDGNPYVINAVDTNSTITNLEHSINAGTITTTVTESVPVHNANGAVVKDANGNVLYETNKKSASVDISGYVSNVVKNEAGDAIVEVNNNQTTIEQAINNNYSKIVNNTTAITDINNNNLSKVTVEGDTLTFQQTIEGKDASVTYTDKHITGHSMDLNGDKIVSSITTNFGDTYNNEIRVGDATINYDGDANTQNTSTIQEAINNNYNKIVNVENNYVSNITDGDYSDRNNHTWNLTQNITVDGNTTTQTVTVKDLNTTNKLLATDWLPNEDRSGRSDDILVTLMDSDNQEVHSTIYDVAKASLVGKLTDITGNDDVHSGVRARVGNDQGVTIATLVGEAYTEAYKKTKVQSGDSNLIVTPISPMSDEENTAVIYNVQTNPDSAFRSITINPNIDSGVVNNDAGINMNNTKIINVQDGEISPTSKDAINGSQLYQTNQNLDRLGNRLDKVGAGAAALAALHPMDFDPDDKLQFSAGVGNYSGETAAALGAFYRPTEKVMFSVAGTMGNGENMVNAGVTFALDRKNNVSNSRVAMAREIQDLRDQVAALTALVTQLAGRGNPLLDTVMFPDVPENHWAYDYVENLQKRGIIEGYPDGNFGGDRSCTRYEYAAMLYRALEKGFPVDSRLLDEFKAELGRIRIDRIKGLDSDANKVERVRVNDYEGRDDYGSKLAQVVADAAPVIEEPAA